MVGGVKGEGGDGDGPCMAANGRLGVVGKKATGVGAQFSIRNTKT